MRGINYAKDYSLDPIHIMAARSVTYRITKKDTVIKLVRTGIQRERVGERGVRERERESSPRARFEIEFAEISGTPSVIDYVG